MNECTELWWDDSYQGWLCAFSEANPQKKRKEQDEIEETTSEDVSPSEGTSKGKDTSKGKGNTFYNCGEQRHFAREC